MMQVRGRRPVRGLVRVLVRVLPGLLALLAFAAFIGWESVQGRYSTASHASVLAVIGVMLVLASMAGRARQRVRSRTWLLAAARAPRRLLRDAPRSAAAAGTLVWVVLILATIAWDATSFAEQRHSLPTLSRLFGSLTAHDWGRALVFAAWLALGLYLAIGWRLPVGEARTDRLRADASHRVARQPARPTTGPARPTTGPARPTTGPARPTTGPAPPTTGPAEWTETLE